MENKNEQVEQAETMKAPQSPSGGGGGGGNNQKLLTSSKSEVIGSFIGMGIVGFCFGIGLMLAVKTVNNLEELIRR